MSLEVTYDTYKTTSLSVRLCSTKENVSHKSSYCHLEINAKGSGEKKVKRFIKRFSSEIAAILE